MRNVDCSIFKSISYAKDRLLILLGTSLSKARCCN